jgi:myo-inositol 2-dehydrogenase / D-chiro-inositol 1-dehydrogenase
MSIGIGVLGTGSIGSDHARRVAHRVSGAHLAALFDVDTNRLSSLRDELGVVVHARAEDLIEDPAVEAIVVASPGRTHTDLVLGCIEMGKPVLCEKPLAPTTKECLQVLDAEVGRGSRLVRVGFMRRYDRGYLQVKRALDDGNIGVPLVLHCIHRSLTAPLFFTNEMTLTDAAVHEIDVARWLIREELIEVSRVPVKRSPLVPEPLRDPAVLLCRSESGVLVDVEVFVSSQYGYDVRCELVGSSGFASLETPTTSAVVHRGLRSQGIPPDWQTRFSLAYLDELQDWVDGLRSGEVIGPTAWDGYAATAVAEACLRSDDKGGWSAVSLVDRPKLYW